MYALKDSVLSLGKPGVLNSAFFWNVMGIGRTLKAPAPLWAPPASFFLECYGHWAYLESTCAIMGTSSIQYGPRAGGMSSFFLVVVVVHFYPKD
jgi:hypothetical protein